jgi:hypothetical protein
MKIPVRPATALMACIGAAFAADGQSPSAHPTAEASYAITVVHHEPDRALDAFQPAVPLVQDPANPQARTVLRTDLADGDFQPARPISTD